MSGLFFILTPNKQRVASKPLPPDAIKYFPRLRNHALLLSQTAAYRLNFLIGSMCIWMNQLR